MMYIIRTVRSSCRAPHAPSALAMASPSASLDCKHSSERQLDLMHVPTPARPRALVLGRTLCPSMPLHTRGKRMLEAGKHASQKHVIRAFQRCHPVWLSRRERKHLRILSGDKFAIHHNMLRPVVPLAACNKNSASFTSVRHAASLSLMVKSCAVRAEHQNMMRKACFATGQCLQHAPWKRLHLSPSSCPLAGKAPPTCKGV